MEGKIAAAAFQLDDPRIHVRGLVVAIFHGSLQTVDTLAGNPVIEGIDDAPDSTAAVEQRGRAAQYLDGFRQHRLDADRVVRAEARNVGGGDAVAQVDRSRSGLSANHRPANTGAEGRVGNARPVAEGLAEAAGRQAPELIAAKDSDRQGGFRRFLVNRHGHEHVLHPRFR